MDKIDIKFELLELFDEDEINYVCKNADLNIFLEQIKKKRYEKYAKKLGRLDRKSELVKKLLPEIAFKLYQKGEEPFIEAVANQLNIYREKFLEVISKEIKLLICIDEINEYDDEKMVDLYFELLDIYQSDIPCELFFIFLKAQGIIIEEETHKSIKKEIEKIREKRELEEKCKRDICNALKEQEKKIYSEFERQKQKLREQINKEKTLNLKIQEKLCDTEQKLQEQERLIQNERKRLETEWFSEYQKKILMREKEDDMRWKTATEEAEIKYQQLLTALDDEAKQKKAELEENYQKLLKDSEKLLSVELTELTEKKNLLVIEINELEQRKEELNSHIQELDTIEEKYFESFEKRIIERKIDSIIFQKLGYENQKDNTNSDIPLVGANLSDVFVIPTRQFDGNVEYGADVSSIEDFFEDYKTNISLYFDNETEIAGTVLSAILNGMGIIAIDKVCNYLSEAFSALLYESSPLVINIDSEKESLKTLADIVNESEAQVVCIKGILDNYNEILFARMCEVCKKKYLFFAVSDLKNLEMMSKAMLNYAIVIDAESELHFPADDYLLIGNHDLKLFIPELDMRKNQEIYKKTFSRLVMNGYIRKTTSIEYSNLLQLYFALVGGSTLGEIMQKGIIYACAICSEDENLGDVLNKSGITIPVK